MDSSIDAHVYSYDFIRVNTLITRYFDDSTSTPLAVGTDNRYSATNYVTNVLSEMANGTMNALNYHQYINCDVGTIGINESIFDMECLEKITEYALIYQTILQNETNQMNISLWIGESALHSSGGKDGETNVFASSFYFIFQLCELAQYELMDLVLRQTLSGGYYELINGTDDVFVPNSDYFVLWFWRQLIGDAMLESMFDDASEYLNGYAFRGQVEGEVVVVIINFSFDAAVNVKLDFRNNDVNRYAFEEYHMNGPLNTSLIYVNGGELVYKEGKFPGLNGVAGNGNVQVEPATIVWIRCTPVDA